MKRMYTLLLAFCCLLLPISALAEDDLMYDLGSRAAEVGMDLLNFEPGADNILGLTNAGHAMVKGKTTEHALTGITDVSRLSNGNNNLFQVNRPNWKPLWFYFFNKDSGMAAYMEPDAAFYSMSTEDRKSLAADKAFSQISLMQVDLDKMLANPNEGNTTFNKKNSAEMNFPLSVFPMSGLLAQDMTL